MSIQTDMSHCLDVTKVTRNIVYGTVHKIWYFTGM